MRSSSSTPQVYQRDPTEHRPRLQNCHKKADKDGNRRSARAMTDPRLQDLTELPRRMSATLDLRALGEDLVIARHRGHRSGHRRHRAVGQAGRPADHSRRPRDRRRRPPDGARRDLRPARRVPGRQAGARRLPPHQRPRRQARGRPGRAGLARPLRAERRAAPAARLARRVRRPHVPRPPRGRLQPGRPRLLAAAQRHRRQRDRERTAVRRAPVDPHAVPLADRAAPRRDLPRRPRDRRDAVREPADHRAVRHHPGRVEGEPGLPGCGPSIRTTGSVPGRRSWRRTSTATPFHDEYRVVSRGRRRALGGRPHGDPAGRRRPADPDPGNDLRHHGPEARGAGALPPREPRSADRPSEPRPVPRRARRGDRAGAHGTAAPSARCTWTSTTSSS